MFENKRMKIAVLTLVAVLVCYAEKKSERSFTIDFDNNTFLKDGEPFRYVSGSLHYFRVPHQFWKDRLTKMKAAGLNAVQTYIEWNSHEPEPGQFDFTGDLDLLKFAKTAQKVGLVVILRVGPFIDAERDMGGLPYWLLRMKKDMVLRTADTVYLQYVDLWLQKLLPYLRPAFYSNGGPIVMLGVENEYGSYFACDKNYTSLLRDMFIKYSANEALLFTTDGNQVSTINCGAIDGVYATVDFGAGTDVSAAFAVERTKAPKGPLVNSEYYPGWLDHWGYPHSVVSTDAVVKTLNEMLAINASVNFYMFHGGTSFGFTSGSNLGDTFQVCPTSYDYDAPLTEAADPTDKYFAIREVVGKYLPLPPIPLPTPSPKMKLSPIKLSPVQSLFHYLQKTSKTIVAEYPLTFEELYQAKGFVLYQTKVNFMPTSPALLSVPGVHDRGYVFVNRNLQGILSRGDKITSLSMLAIKDQTISILIENQGRICFGKDINDFKGIIGNVTLGGKVLSNWSMTPVNLTTAYRDMKNKLNSLHDAQNVQVPAFYSGQFVLPDETPVYDTFLRVDGWYKGVAYVNGYNLGRYWPYVGPQQTLYVPSVYLNPNPEVNTIVLLELEYAPCLKDQDCSITFTDIPVINGPTPNRDSKNMFVKY